MGEHSPLTRSNCLWSAVKGLYKFKIQGIFMKVWVNSSVMVLTIHQYYTLYQQYFINNYKSTFDEITHKREIIDGVVLMTFTY